MRLTVRTVFLYKLALILLFVNFKKIKKPLQILIFITSPLIQTIDVKRIKQ
jgi:hypothetical protein